MLLLRSSNMGCCCCNLFHCCGGFSVNEDMEGQDFESLSDLKRLGLTSKEIDIFYKAFCRIDKSRRGSFRISDFLEYMNVEISPFVFRVFGELDLSTDGVLNFREFTLTIWKFCSRRREGIADMAFSMYDATDSGDLSSAEISKMIKECYGRITESINVWDILEKFDSDGNSKVSREEFRVLCKKYPTLLQPALDFQSKMKALISTNKNFWNKIYVSSNRTINERKVQMLFRMPDKIDSVRDLVRKHASVKDTSHVKGYSYDNNLGIASTTTVNRGKDKWVRGFEKPKSKAKPKKNKRIGASAVHYGLFDAKHPGDIF